METKCVFASKHVEIWLQKNVTGIRYAVFHHGRGRFPLIFKNKSDALKYAFASQPAAQLAA